MNLSKALDALGFSYDCIKHRQKSWEMCGENVSNQSNNIEDNITVFMAGSKAEGLSRLLEGDLDLMLSVNDFICYGNEREMESNMLMNPITKVSIKDGNEIQNESPDIVYSRAGKQLELADNESKDHYRTELKQGSFEFKTVKVKKQATGTDEKVEKLGNENVCDLKSDGVVESVEQCQDLTKNPGETNLEHANEAKNIKYDGVFLMDTKNVAAGYTMLKVVHLDEKKLLNAFTGLEGKAIVEAQVKRNGETILSSDRFLYKYYEKDLEEDTETIAGPSGRSLRNEFCGSAFESDSVCSIPCICRRINHLWLSRVRKFDWPRKELINEISTLDGHVVPVGFKDSNTSSIEWRICYTLAEIKLVQSFNETQLKLHALLKIVGKSLLNKKSPDITSYILKNILLWMSEKIPPEKFQNGNLFGLLRVALKFLKRTIQKRYLPNYMIPERNLYDGKLPENERIDVLKVLDELTCGGYFIERYKELELLSKHMHIAAYKPDLVEYMNSNRLQLESIFRQYWKEIYEARVNRFVPVCLEKCTSLKSVVTLCKILGVSLKTKELVIERVFWWITGWKEEDIGDGRIGDNSNVDDSNGEHSTNPFWSWTDSGNIIHKSVPYLSSDEEIAQLFCDT